MKTWLYLAVGVAVGVAGGVILGSRGPKAELRQAKRELAELRRQAERQKSPIAALLHGVRAIVPVPERPQPASCWHRELPGHLAPEPDLSASPLQVTVVSSAVPPAVEGTAVQLGTIRGRPTVEERDEIIKTISEGQHKEEALARRNSFLSNVTTSHAEAAAFDVVVAAMNLRMGESIRRWAQIIKADGGQMTMETSLRMGHDLYGIFVQAYDDLDRSLPTGWREKAGEDFLVCDFIDPQVLMPMLDLEEFWSRHQNLWGTSGWGNLARL